MTHHLPHIYEVLTDNHLDVLTHARALVIGNRDEQYKILRRDAKPYHCILDLVGVGVPMNISQAAAAD